jgi:hypothetical protein
MCYIDNLTQIIKCRKLEVRYICFEIKDKYKMDSNLIEFSWNAKDEILESSCHKLSLQLN